MTTPTKKRKDPGHEDIASSQKRAKGHRHSELVDVHMAKWQTRLPMLSGDLTPMHVEASMVAVASGSWLARGVNAGGGEGWGCIACASAGSSDGKLVPGFSSYSILREKLQICNLLRHHEAHHHKMNVLRCLGVSMAPTEHGLMPISGSAPRANAFRLVWDVTLKGTSIAKGLSCPELGRVGDRQKIYRMQDCIAEAMWALDRQFLANACCATLCRDERKSRLLIRYRATTPDLRVRCGILGQVKHRGTGALQIARSTVDMVDMMCHTYRIDKSGVGETGTQDATGIALSAHIKDIIESSCVDSASDEVLAAAILAGGSADEFLKVTWGMGSR